eukprot:4056440-Prymnesium_polylepis.1
MEIAFLGSPNPKIASARPNHGGPRRARRFAAPYTHTPPQPPQIPSAPPLAGPARGWSPNCY